MLRRAVFPALAALGGAASFGAAPSRAATPTTLRFGLATYSLRSFRRDAAIRMIKQMGISCADVKEFHLPYNDSPAELAAGRKQFDEAGIEVIGGGNISMKEADEASLRRHFDYARACRFPVMICSPTHENLAVVEKLARQYDIKIAIHNHGPEDKQFPTPRSVLAAVNNMDPRMGLCIDIGHTARTGDNVVESIAAAGPRLFEMHIKDLKSAKDDNQCVVGEGVLPIPAVFRELRRIGYSGVCSLEYEADQDDPVPGMWRSFSYMRGVVAGQNS